MTKHMEEEDSDPQFAPFDPTAFLRRPSSAPSPAPAPSPDTPLHRPPVIRLTSSPDTSSPIPNTDTTANTDNTKPDTADRPKDSTSVPDTEKWRCPICLECLQQPVVTHCGHAFCYPCITEWLRRSNSCPVCHGEIANSQLIPIYGQGSEADLSSPPPPRPEYRAAQRDARARVPGFQFRFALNEANIRAFFAPTPQKALLLAALIFLIATFYV